MMTRTPPVNPNCAMAPVPGDHGGNDCVSGTAGTKPGGTGAGVAGRADVVTGGRSVVVDGRGAGGGCTVPFRGAAEPFVAGVVGVAVAALAAGGGSAAAG